MHGLGADPNLYAYVSGRAMQAVDPMGLSAISLKLRGVVSSAKQQPRMRERRLWSVCRAGASAGRSGSSNRYADEDTNLGRTTRCRDRRVRVLT